MEKVNVKEKFSLFNDHWNPRIAGEVNDSHIKLAKLKGEFDWHHHEQEDEMFYVVKGELLLKFKDSEDVLLKEGEFLIVPKGVEHKPVAEEEAHVILIEPKTTLNTGNIKNERTRENLERL
ncbi:cupin domain-containing protein [Pseudalkalibacillus caeni]|uniref:Cupin domain-containing protein n=1 Tax=Exobacillus caeni TaxID=2574798 RepID=A0A5R9F479_9BACL|nr:cupin domain-containing protein [Pseudalkalibacillus caeni]TLS37156.1 cupin domain-containing protein [Pseudalkalibacillus caeni]